MRRRTILEALAVGTTITLAACSAARSSAVGGEPSGGEAPVAEAPLTSDAACRARTTFLAFVDPGQCVDQESANGRWTARALFADAPESLRQTACRFTWAPGPGSTSPADVEALATLEPTHLTEESPASRCEPRPPEGSARPRLPKDGGDVGPPTGVTGCDVCVELQESRVFVLLPANAPGLRTLIVGTSDGRVSSFDLVPPEGAQAFSVRLPALPSGVTYQADDIHLIASSF